MWNRPVRAASGIWDVLAWKSTASISTRQWQPNACSFDWYTTSPWQGGRLCLSAYLRLDVCRLNSIYQADEDIQLTSPKPHLPGLGTLESTLRVFLPRTTENVMQSTCRLLHDISSARDQWPRDEKLSKTKQILICWFGIAELGHVQNLNSESRIEPQCIEKYFNILKITIILF